MFYRKYGSNGNSYRRFHYSSSSNDLSDKTYQKMRDMAIHMMRSIGDFEGGCNVQFAVSPDEKEDIIAIEINPRVSRSSALASKATGYPIAKVATKLPLVIL